MATVPANWASQFASTTVTMPPGGTASTTLTVTAPTSATDGFYDVGLTAANAQAPSYKD